MGAMQIWQGVFNAVGQLIQGRQQANELRNQADVEQFNIDNAKQNLAITNRQTSAREEALRRSARQALGAQRAAIAQSGTGFGGSNAAIMQQSTANSELDALNLRYAGQLEAAGIQNEITMRQYNKTALRKSAKYAMRLRWHNAGAAIFGATTVNQPGGTTLPSTSSGAYGQGSLGNFGNNMDNFTGQSYNLSGGYGSINSSMGFSPGSSSWSQSNFGSGMGGS